MKRIIQIATAVLVTGSLLFIVVFWIYSDNYNQLAKTWYNSDEETRSNESLNMELVTIFYLTYENATEKLIREREKEYATVLQCNLNHDHVKKIHVLSTDARELEERLGKHYQLFNLSKLLIVERNSTNRTRDIYDYISENLVGVDVMHLNGDIYLGGGFDRVDPVVMRKNKIMYTLSRQLKSEESCGGIDYCHEKRYRGSHDTFLFHLTEPIPETVLQHLNFMPGSWGMEQIIMWLFNTKLGYCLLNPCTILETFHFHCTNLRNADRKRVNNASNTWFAPFTKELVCSYLTQKYQH